jgi:hypothetical protein
MTPAVGVRRRNAIVFRSSLPMSGPIVRTGATPEFWSNWDKVFGGKSPGAAPKKKSTGKKPAADKQASAKKTAGTTPKKATAKKVTAKKTTAPKAAATKKKPAASKKKTATKARSKK